MALGTTNAQELGAASIPESSVTLTDAQRTVTDTKYLKRGTYIVSVYCARPAGASPATVETVDLSEVRNSSGGTIILLGRHISSKTVPFTTYQGPIGFFSISKSANVSFVHSVGTGGGSNFGSMTHTMQIVRLG